MPYVGYDQISSPGCPDIGGRAWCVVPDASVEKTTDHITASRVVELLTSHKQHAVSPFFIAAGFIRPHLDWAAPKAFWDRYPEDSIKMPAHREFDTTAPKEGWVDGAYLNNKVDDLGGRTIQPFDPFPPNITLKWRRACALAAH